jgi:hypothetical protein
MLTNRPPLVRTLLAACVVAVPMTMAHAQSPRPGLWEHKSRVVASPVMEAAMAQAQAMLANLPPEQRKQMEATLRKQGVSLMGLGKNGETVTRSCLSKEMAERRTPPAMQPGCTAKAGAIDGNKQSFGFSCPGRGSGEGVVTYDSDTEVHMAMTLTGEDARVQGMSVKIDSISRFVASECGDVKPPVMPK